MTLLFFILLTSLSLAQFSDTTNVILLRFSEPMDISGLVEKKNYSLKDTLNNFYNIYDVKIVKQAGDQTFPDTSCVAIITERLPYRKFLIEVDSVKDKAGNIIGEQNKVTFVFYGKKNLEKPQINLRRQ